MSLKDLKNTNDINQKESGAAWPKDRGSAFHEPGNSETEVNAGGGRSRRNRGMDSGRKSRRKEESLESGSVLKSIVILIVIAAAVILALVAAYVFKNRPAKEVETTTAEVTTEAPPAFTDVPEPVINEIPEIDTLVKEYFDARLSADTETLLKLFGRHDTSRDEELEKLLTAQAAWIQGFKKIETYSVPGIDENGLFCIVKYEIDFRRTDTYAPGIMYFYAEKSPEGGYTIVENMVKDVHDYADAVLAGEKAQQMAEEVRTSLRDAVNSDGNLALIYDSFQNGEIYSEIDIDLSEEQQIDLFLNPEDSILINR